MDRLSQNLLLGFSSFLRVRTPVLASRDQTLCAVSDETHETATVELDSGEVKIRRIRQTIVRDAFRDRRIFRAIGYPWKMLCNFITVQKYCFFEII